MSAGSQVLVSKGFVWCCGLALAASAAARAGQVCPPTVLQPPEFSPFTRFGAAVAVDEDVAVVGRYEFGIGGAVYVYRRIGSDWLLGQQLVPPDPSGGDWFGWRVAVDGDFVLVSAFHHVHPEPLSAGVAYVFQRQGGRWGTPQTLYAWNPVFTMFDAFAGSIDICGDLAIVGDRVDSEAGPSAGAAYIFRFNPSTGLWEQEQKLFGTDPERTVEDFGRAVAVRDDLAIVTSIGIDAGPVANAGAAYVFRYQPEARRWVQEQKLVANNFDGQANDFFGASAAMSRDGRGGYVAIIGATDDDPPGGFPQSNGSAYIFRRDPVSGWWSQEQELLPTLDTGANFGEAAAIEGDWAIVGAPSYVNPGGVTGLALVYHYDGSTWRLVHTYTPLPGMTGNVIFGGSVGISNNTAIAGAQGAFLFSGAAVIHTINPLFADLNCDDVVDGLDVTILLESWGPLPPSPPGRGAGGEGGASAADLNDDGVVNGFDLALLLAAWG